MTPTTYPEQITAHKLAALLLAQPDLPVEIKISNPQDVAWTRVEIEVTKDVLIITRPRRKSCFVVRRDPAANYDMIVEEEEEEEEEEE